MAYEVYEKQFALAVRIVAAALAQTTPQSQSKRLELPQEQDLIKAIHLAYNALQRARESIVRSLDQEFEKDQLRRKANAHEDEENRWK